MILQTVKYIWVVPELSGVESKISESQIQIPV